jgi:hypothetical protein
MWLELSSARFQYGLTRFGMVLEYGLESPNITSESAMTLQDRTHEQHPPKTKERMRSHSPRALSTSALARPELMTRQREVWIQQRSQMEPRGRVEADAGGVGGFNLEPETSKAY